MEKSYMVGMKGKLVAVAAFTALTACGGGGGGGSIPIAANGPAIRVTDGSTPSGDLAAIQGNTAALGTAILVVDDGREFVSFDGTETGEALEYDLGGGITILRIRPERASAGSTTYGFVRYIDVDYPSTTTYGVLGNNTRLADMPTTGSANYTGNGTGEAYVWIDGSGTPVFLQDGNVTVSVDFGGTQHVDVTVTNLTGSIADTDYTIQDLAIFENTFVKDGGTTFSITSSSPDLNFTGTTSGADFNASGVFAGFNDGDGAVNTTSNNNKPAEVVGAVVATNDDDTFFGRFAAD